MHPFRTDTQHENRMLKSPPDMTPHLGKTIDKFCQRSLGLDLSQNHCAHFVSHMMEYDSLPTTCANQSDADKAMPEKGAALRVDEIFNRSSEVGHWADRPLGMVSCLAFATIASNMNECGSILAMLKVPINMSASTTPGPSGITVSRVSGW